MAEAKKEFERRKREAEQGNVIAQNNLGVCYRIGKGVAKDEKKAFEWYEKAAKQGNAKAQCNLGFCYENGWGVAKDEKKAFEWYEKAAKQGNAKAQCNLGFCYENGWGVAKDEKKALEWYEKSEKDIVIASTNFKRLQNKMKDEDEKRKKEAKSKAVETKSRNEVPEEKKTIEEKSENGEDVRKPSGYENTDWKMFKNSTAGRKWTLGLISEEALKERYDSNIESLSNERVAFHKRILDNSKSWPSAPGEELVVEKWTSKNAEKLRSDIEKTFRDAYTTHNPLRVCVVGGGPTGLIAAINLAELLGKGVRVSVYDIRWEQLENGTVVSNARRRRDQVVTLQRDALRELSVETLKCLFANYDEPVWFDISRNIPIREVEDRLLVRAQMFDIKNLIELTPILRERMETMKTRLLRESDVIIGADGGSSWTRRTFFELKNMDIEDEGRKIFWDKTMGVAFQIPLEDLRKGDDNRSLLEIAKEWQALNTAVTLSQRRYLVNASTQCFDPVTKKQCARGFLNIQLSEEEYKRVITRDGKACTFRNPAFVRDEKGNLPNGEDEEKEFLPLSDCKNFTETDIQLAETIKVGLKMFDIDLKRHVKSINRIKILLRWTEKVVTEKEDTIIALIGDAAFQTHFWPGRGMNSGIKTATALVLEIGAMMYSGKRPLASRLERGEKKIFRSGVIHDSEMNKFSAFVNSLRNREHAGRSELFVCGKEMSDVIKKAKLNPVVHRGLNYAKSLTRRSMR